MQKLVLLNCEQNTKSKSNQFFFKKNVLIFSIQWKYLKSYFYLISIQLASQHVSFQGTEALTPAGRIYYL